MRTVKIDNKGGLIDVMCPLCFNHPETLGVKCGNECAWFRIDEGGRYEDGKWVTTRREAYCKDHVIGRLELDAEK